VSFCAITQHEVVSNIQLEMSYAPANYFLDNLSIMILKIKYVLYGVMTDGNRLNYMRARYYSAEIRRFVNQDILLGNVADGQSLNRFAFVTGNPVSFVDPFGLAKVEVVIDRQQWHGHSAIIIDDTVYTNGRYEFPDREMKSGGAIGPNVLVKQSTSAYMSKRLKSPGTVSVELNLSDSEVSQLLAFYDDLVKHSSPIEGRPSNWYQIDRDYYFLGDNCATLVAEALQDTLPKYQGFLLVLAQDPITLQVLLHLTPGLVKNTKLHKSMIPPTPEGYTDSQWLRIMGGN
jgi:RHS repeat-associated protein